MTMRIGSYRSPTGSPWNGADIAALRPRGDVDGLIAATAIVHDLILVTRNVGDFEDTRVSLINPWNIG